MAYLLILKGPNEGHWFAIDRGLTKLGRAPDCDIVLRSADPTKENNISQHHAMILFDKGEYYLEDGDGHGKKSKNKTRLNGAVVPHPKRAQLTNNDIIGILEFELLFHHGPDPDTEAETPSSVNASVKASSSSVFAQTVDKLRLLLEIGNQLSSTLDITTLLPRIVDNLLQHFKYADRAFLIEVDPVTRALVPRILKSRASDKEANVVFSVSIVRQCLRTVEGLLSNDPKAQFPDSESVAGLAIETAMCAPLWNQDGKAFGVLLLDGRNAKRKFSEVDLNFLMGVASQASIALINAHSHQDALIRERYVRDLSLASQVVKSFLPIDVPEIAGYEFFASTQPALEVGGDYFDFVPLEGNRLAILVGDVSGKGVAAALVMSRFSAEARCCLRTAPDLGAALSQINDLMQPLNLTDRFVTLAAMILDATNGTLTVANAGHPMPIVVRKASGAMEDAIIKSDVGLPMGVLEGYRYEARSVILEAGDTVVLVSDGITEAVDKKGRPFGTEGLYAVLKQATGGPKQIAERILDAVKKHDAGCPQHDDITLVCFGRLP